MLQEAAAQAVQGLSQALLTVARLQVAAGQGGGAVDEAAWPS